MRPGTVGNYTSQAPYDRHPHKKRPNPAVPLFAEGGAADVAMTAHTLDRDKGMSTASIADTKYSQPQHRAETAHSSLTRDTAIRRNYKRQMSNAYLNYGNFYMKFAK